MKKPAQNELSVKRIHATNTAAVAKVHVLTVVLRYALTKVTRINIPNKAKKLMIMPKIC